MKNRFEKILQELDSVKEKVFWLPLERAYLLKLSEKTGVKFPEVYIQYREKFGFTHDLLPELLQTEDSLIDDLDYTESWCEDFFPIGTYSTRDIDYTWLVKKNSDTGEIYQVDNEEEENAKPESIQKTLQSLIEQEIEDVKSGLSPRLNNAEKARLFAFRVDTGNFKSIFGLFSKIAPVKWIDEVWRDKYSPNILGIEIAFLSLGRQQIMIEREKETETDNFVYFFETEEPLEKIENLSLAEKIKEVFDREKVEYNFIDYGVTEIGFEE